MRGYRMKLTQLCHTKSTCYNSLGLLIDRSTSRLHYPCFFHYQQASFLFLKTIFFLLVEKNFKKPSSSKISPRPLGLPTSSVHEETSYYAFFLSSGATYLLNSFFQYFGSNSAIRSSTALIKSTKYPPSYSSKQSAFLSFGILVVLFTHSKSIDSNDTSSAGGQSISLIFFSFRII